MTVASAPLGASSTPPTRAQPDDSSYILADTVFDASLASLCYCAHCSQGFDDLAALAAHEQSHAAERTELCPVVTCRRHTHGFAFWHECARHALRHYDALIVCPYCPEYLAADVRTFARADHFARHLNDVHDPFEAAGDAPCPVCAAVSLKPWDLSIHFNSCVLQHLFEQQIKQLGQTGAFSDWDTEASSTEVAAGTEVGKVEVVEEVSASEVKTEQGRRKHPAKWQCSLCPKRYTRASALRAHTNNHTGVRPFECGTCGLAFTRNHDRKTHEALHQGGRNFACPERGCTYQASRASNLERHRRRHLKKERHQDTKVRPENASESQNAAMVLAEMAAGEGGLFDEL